jgi:glutamate 5-kinase
MAMTADRVRLITKARVVVVKVGTQVLADESGRLSSERIATLAEQIDRLAKGGRRVILVSSGAIGAGVGRLKLSARPTELPGLQACAAVGQPYLMTAWESAFGPLGMPTAQILLNAADFDNRSRYLNMRNTLASLFEMGCVPIINENDTTSVAEIKFGDNDRLAALVAGLIQADLLVLLSGVDGLFDGDPRVDQSASRVSWVDDIDSVLGLAQATKSRLGTGGMRSKL